MGTTAAAPQIAVVAALSNFSAFGSTRNERGRVLHCTLAQALLAPHSQYPDPGWDHLTPTPALFGLGASCQRGL